MVGRIKCRRCGEMIGLMDEVVLARDRTTEVENPEFQETERAGMAGPPSEPGFSRAWREEHDTNA